MRIAPGPGHFVYLQFWASWCGGCMMEMPSIVKLYQSLPHKRLTFLSVSLDYRKQKALDAVKEMKITFPVIFSGKGWEDPLVTRFGVESIPHNVILNSDLEVVGEDLFGKTLERALSAIDRGDMAAWDTIREEAAGERADIDTIEALLRSGNRGAAIPAMRKFLENHPDSDAAPGVRRYLASLESGEGPAAEAPSPEELKPPDFDLPKEIFVPAFAVGSPAKRTSGYLRQLAGAIEAYREDRERYPAGLADLVRDGAYLADLPPDPFGGSFRYASDGRTWWILAGKGPDGEEDARVDEYRGDPGTVAAALYRDPEEEKPDTPAKGDIIAYRSLIGSRTETGPAPEKAE